MKLLFFLISFLFINSFAAQPKTQHKVVVFLHPTTATAEIHTGGEILTAKSTKEKSLFHFEFTVANSAQLLSLFHAMVDAEQQAKNKKIEGDSQWIKQPGSSIALSHLVPKK